MKDQRRWARYDAPGTYTPQRLLLDDNGEPVARKIHHHMGEYATYAVYFDGEPIVVDTEQGFVGPRRKVPDFDGGRILNIRVGGIGGAWPPEFPVGREIGADLLPRVKARITEALVAYHGGGPDNEVQVRFQGDPPYHGEESPKWAGIELTVGQRWIVAVVLAGIAAFALMLR